MILGEQSSVYERMRRPMAPIFDHAFTLLHIELAQWPDKWHVDKHGTETNPHVWFPAQDVWSSENSANIAIIFRDQCCPCGKKYSAWSLEQLEAAATATTSADTVQIAMMLNGLVTRDVQ